MKIERLNPEQYAELATVEEGFIPPADQSLVFVARDETGKIVGRNVVLLLPHIEGTWVEPAHRGSTLMPRLMDAAESELAKLGASGSIRLLRVRRKQRLPNENGIRRITLESF